MTGDAKGSWTEQKKYEKYGRVIYLANGNKFLSVTNDVVELKVKDPKGGKYLVFVSSCSVKMRGFNFLSLHAFNEKCVYFSIFE